MFLIPIGTDAPVYHFPWGTIALIALSTGVLLAASLGWLPPPEILAVDYGLSHGEGLQPAQWITSNFLHAGWTHLIGNMMFLWAFGLIVEGKIGWIRFVPMYLGLGLAECILEQSLLSGPGVSVGASAIVFGLMAIALIWAPRNDIELAYGVWMPFLCRIDSFGVSVFAMSLMMFAIETLLAVYWKFPIGSELFHLVGAALGVGMGLSMLKAGLVDCEGWDIVSLWKQEPPLSGSHPALPALLDGRAPELEELSAEQQNARKTGRKLRALARIHEQLRRGDPIAAWNELLRTRRLLDDFQLGPRDLVRLGQALSDAAAWTQTVAVYEELIDRFPQSADLARLIVAEVLIRHQGRPAAALRYLTQVDPSRLTGKEPLRHSQLQTIAAEMIDAGVVELDGRSWASL